MTDRQRIELEKIAEQARDQYVKLRQLSFKGYVPHSRHGAEFWFRVAEAIQKQGMEPKSFVNLVIEKVSSKYPQFPWPESLLQTDVTQELVEARVSHKNTALVKVRCMAGLYKASVATGKPVMDIILDKTLYFNPIFRYAMAYTEGLPETADFLKKDAEEFDKKWPVYRELLKAFLPEDFGCH